MTELERVGALTNDEASIDAELNRLRFRNSMAYMLHIAAKQNGWDETRLLKTLVVVFAAAERDAMQLAIELHARRPIIIELP